MKGLYNIMLSFQVFLYSFLDTLTGHIILVIFLFTMMDNGILWKRLKKLPFLVLSPIIVTIIAIGMFYIIPEAPFIIRYFFNSLCILFMCILWVIWAWQINFWRAISLICMAGILQIAIVALIQSIFQICLPNQEIPFVILSGSAIIISFAAAILMKKIRFIIYFQLLLEDNINLHKTALLIFVLELTMDAFLVLQRGIQNQYLILYYLLVIALVILMLYLVVYLAQQFDTSRKLQAQQDIITQQQLYEQDLEAIRQEVRIFRHDYKNLLAGLYQQAGEGELEQLCATLSELDIGFDKRLGEKIKASAQIGNLQIPQVRSCLLTKLNIMREKGIECHLEVLYPIETVGMDIWDFVRCMGILIDNAIEAVEGAEQPWVEIILLAQERWVNFQVSNPWNEAVDKTQFWEEGWSTKGTDRGLGLSSYLRILANYPNVFPCTSWANNVFVQALTIGGIS